MLLVRSTIAGIQQGFEELNAGLTRQMVDFVQEMQQKYDMSEMLGKTQSARQFNMVKLLAIA